MHSKAHAWLIDTILDVSARVVFSSWLVIGWFIDIPLSCPYLEVEYLSPIMFIHDRCVLSSHSIHFQPHKQAACVVKKVIFPSLPYPSLLFSFPHPLSYRNSAGFSCVERADSIIKAHLAIFVWSPSGYICVKPIWLHLCEAHLATFVWSPSGYICMKPIWLHLSEAHLATFVWSPSGNICMKPIWLHLCEAHLAISKKPIWLFLRSPSGYFWEAHLAISEKPIWHVYLKLELS